MPKSITGSVGRGGRNFPASDVMTVQYLLNCVPATQGGPSPELVVDGAAGPKTIAAIEKYQRAIAGACDGRVDPGGATLRALQARDPYPNQPLGPAAAKTAPYGKGTPASPPWKDPYGKGPSDPFAKGGQGQAGWKDPFSKDPYGKGGTAQGGWKDPFSKDPFGKGGTGQGGAKDPFGKGPYDPFGKGGAGQGGAKDPFAKGPFDPFGKGGAGQGSAGQGGAKDPFGKGY
jgi:hypothetical protein